MRLRSARPVSGSLTGEPVDEHEHLVRPAAAHLGRGRPGAGAPDDDAFPSVERAREVAAPALELLAGDRDPARRRRDGELSSRTGSGSSATLTVRSSPGTTSSASRPGA